MGILAWIHNRGGRDNGDMYGGVDRAASPDVAELYEQKRSLALSSKVEVYVHRAGPDPAADVARVWDEAMSRYEFAGAGIEVELHAKEGLVRLIVEPGFEDPEELKDMLVSTCALVEVRDRASESAA